MTRRILVAGIGNIFLGDDGFGCEVACRLLQQPLPDDVRVVDYGIRGLDLAYALLEPYEAIIFVDVIRRGDVAGTIYILEPQGSQSTEATPDPHTMDPQHLMAMARSLGEITAKLYIVGCEPADFGDKLEGRMGLSDTVARSVPEACRTVLELIARMQKRTVGLLDMCAALEREGERA